MVGNLPIHFSWASKAAELDSECRRSADQIIEELRSPGHPHRDQSSKQSSKPPLPKQSTAAMVGGRRKPTTVEKAKKVIGPAQNLGPSIEELFDHSYPLPNQDPLVPGHLAGSRSRRLGFGTHRRSIF